jgi:hypothetical protein
MSADRPTVQVAVVMEREARPNRWEDWRFEVIEVVPDDDGGFGDAVQVLRDDGRRRRTLHPGFVLQLFADEGEGYHLNLTSGAPVWFVMWRLDDEDAVAGRPPRSACRTTSRPLARCAGAGRQRAAAGARCASGCRPTPTHYRPEPKQRPAAGVRSGPPGERQ